MVARSLFAWILALAFAPLTGTPAQADPAPWSETGVQLRCDAATKSFELVVYVRPLDGEDVLQKGFKGVKAGTSLRGCKLGKRAVLAQIRVTPPARATDCARGGFVDIPSLSVDGVELEEHGETLHWGCASKDGPAIVRITVQAKPGGVSYAVCTTLAAADGTRSDLDCQPRAVEIDEQAAAFAKIDRDLADRATQAATRLPAGEDMAQVFAGQKDPDGLPVCAHWVEFAWASNEVQPWARIGGKPGERTSIYPVYPQACTAKSDPTCKSTAYVIAGDRVDISAVCGPWTAIRYHPRVRAFPDTRGWVATARLYGAQALHETPQPIASIGSSEADKLNKAIGAGDAQAIADAVRNGADPDGPDNSGQPLLFALEKGDRAVAEALLTAGANPDPGVGGWNRVGMSALETVAKVDRFRLYRYSGRVVDPVPLLQMLLQHGAKVDAVDARGLTPLLRAMGASNVDVVAFLLDAGADPNKLRSSGEAYGLGLTPLLEAVLAYGWDHDPAEIRLLLAHGADPNFQVAPRLRNAGETALTIAAREGYLTVVRDLLDHGADPAMQRADGALPADIAQQADHPKIAALLAEAAKQKAKPAPAQP